MSTNPPRQRLPATRPAVVHKFDIAGNKGYIRVGLRDDGQPGELFVNLHRSEQAGPWSVIGILTSLCLQYGVPLHVLAEKLSHTQFPPAGPTNNPDIPFATSVPDYVFRWLGIKYDEEFKKKHVNPTSATPEEKQTEDVDKHRP